MYSTLLHRESVVNQFAKLFDQNIYQSILPTIIAAKHYRFMLYSYGHLAATTQSSMQQLQSYETLNF